MADLATLSPLGAFESAEHDRNQGSVAEAVKKYEFVTDHTRPETELYVGAYHMLAVAYTMLGNYDAAVLTLNNPLDDERCQLDSLKRAQMLRDRANAWRCLKQFDQGYPDIEESLTILDELVRIAQKGDTDTGPYGSVEVQHLRAELAATTGFHARLLFDDGQPGDAILVGRRAWQLFTRGNNRSMAFFHGLWLAEHEVAAGDRSYARTKVIECLELARGVAKPVQYEILATITEFAHQPDEMAAKIAEIRAQALEDGTR